MIQTIDMEIVTKSLHSKYPYIIITTNTGGGVSSGNFECANPESVSLGSFSTFHILQFPYIVGSEIYVLSPNSKVPNLAGKFMIVVSTVTLSGLATSMTCVMAVGGRMGLCAGKSVADGGCNLTFIT